MRRAMRFLVEYRAYFFTGSQLCLLTTCNHWVTKWILLACSLAALFACACFDKWLEESHRALNCPPVCYVYAPVGDYESASFPPDDDGTEPNAPSSFYQTVRERTTSSGYVASDLEPLPVFASNTATARLVLAMPFILGFLVAAILVAGYVFTW